MEALGIIPLDERSSRLRQVILLLEGWLGAFWATVITIGWVGLIGFMFVAVNPSKNWEVALWVVAVLFWLVLEVPFLWRVWTSAMRGHVPLALHVAARQPLRPIPFNLIICLWWLGHFAVGIFAAYWTETRMAPRGEGAAIGAGFSLLMAFFYLFAANIYLVHAVAAVTRGRMVEAIWRYRGLFDVMLAIVAMLTVLQKRL